MATGGLMDYVETIPLFKGLPRRECQEVASIGIEQGFRKGQTIFSEGEEGRGFYVLVTGKVKVFKLSWEGKEQILHIFGPGEPFGEVPVFSGQPFPAHAQALEESRTLFFPRDGLIQLIRKNPDLALNMLAVLSKRLRQFAGLVEDLSLKEVPARLAAYLNYLSDRKEGSHELDLDISKAQLASLLGTIPETLSRILGKMVRAGLIASEGPRVRILNPDGLKEIAKSGGFA